jgi:succinoglycan biosynthesis protein ExoO
MAYGLPDIAWNPRAAGPAFRKGHRMLESACQVSIVIPIFNSAATLARAVNSALRQTVSPLEVLIVDDGSRDASLAEARGMAAQDQRVRVIALTENHGKPFAMNRAIAEARGVWIAVLDADDRYADDRLARLIATAERNDADLVADNQYFLDAGAGQIVRTAFSPACGDRILTKRDFIAGSDPFAEFNFGMLKPVVRADFLRRTGLRYRESARLSEDFLYLVEFFAAGGRAFLVAQPLYHWTQAFGSLSRRWTETGSGPWRYDFLAARTANAEVRDALREPRDSDLIALLHRRDDAFRRLHLIREVTRSRGPGRGLPAVVLAISRHPSIWPLLARRAWSAVSRRVRARGGRAVDMRAGVDGTVT